MAKINNKDYSLYGPFKLWTIENFPFIEEDFDAITNYQLYCRIVENMNKLIANQNKLQDSQKELIDAYNNLVNYVDNYFENLDVQEEINNKLDDMAESGELTELISAYLNIKAILAFNNIAEMKLAEYLIDGSFVKTYGKLTYNDGEGAFYKIREKTQLDVVDEVNIIALYDNELIAELIPDSQINDIKDDIEDIKDDIEDIKDDIEDIENNIKNKDTLPINTKIVAHRGASFDAPENTPIAFTLAIREKFDCIETDIQKTLDGKYVCIHDRSVDRTTDGSGNVDEMTLAQVQSLNITSNYGTQHIPTLVEYLKICKYGNKIPVIELKAETLTTVDVLPIYNIIKSMGMINNVIIISFSTAMLEALREIDENIKIQALIELTSENIQYCKTHKMDIDTSFGSVTSQLVEEAHNNNVKVNCWYVIDIKQIESITNYNLDYITVNSHVYLEGNSSNNIIMDKSESFIQCYNEYDENKVKISNIGSIEFLSRSFVAQDSISPKDAYRNGSFYRAVGCVMIPIKKNDIIYYNIPSGYQLTFHLYNANQLTFSGSDIGWLTGTSRTMTEDDVAFVVPYMKKSDSSEITEYDKSLMRNCVMGIKVS